MFTLEKEFRFEASHVLPHHEGKCARLHGHSWVAAVVIRGETLVEQGSSRGMLVDFATLKAAVQPIIDTYLDHYHLNDTLGLENPTSEAVARWLFNAVAVALPHEVAVMLHSVRVEETCTSRCTYAR